MIWEKTRTAQRAAFARDVKTAQRSKAAGEEGTSNQERLELGSLRPTIRRRGIPKFRRGEGATRRDGYFKRSRLQQQGSERGL